MIKISDCIQEIVKKNSSLQFGFSNDLLNLSKLSNFLKPLIEARTKKSVKKSAILMNLSRFHRIQEKINPKEENFRIDNISVISSLCSLTFYKTRETHKAINMAYNKILRQKDFMTLSEGSNEITTIVSQKCLNLLTETVKEKPKAINENLVGLGINFDESYTDAPGFIYVVLQKLAVQGINIIEISSTLTELIIYIDKNSTKLAFDTIFNGFSE